MSRKTSGAEAGAEPGDCVTADPSMPGSMSIAKSCLFCDFPRKLEMLTACVLELEMAKALSGASSHLCRFGSGGGGAVLPFSEIGTLLHS